MDAEYLSAQLASRVDQYRGRRTLHRVRPHCSWQGISVRPRQVDADGEPNAVFMNERAQGLDPHGFVVFEDRVQSDDCERRVGEQLGDAQRLWQAACDAPGTEHLEGMKQHYPPPNSCKAERLWRVEPRRHLPLGGGPRPHQKSPSFTYG